MTEINWPSSTDWHWLRNEVAVAARAFAAQLRTISADTQVPGLTWDVRELAAHVATLPDLYNTLNRAEQPFVRPDSWPEYSLQARAHVADRSLGELADLIEAFPETFLGRLDDDPNHPWNLYVPTLTGFVGAGLLCELLLHGMDLSALTNTTITVTHEQALPIVDAMQRLAPAFVDPVAASNAAGVYHLRVRRGRDYTYEIADGALSTCLGRPDKADARMSVDAATFVLVAMGRRNRIVPALTGKMIAYGRMPWKLAALDKIKVEGV